MVDATFSGLIGSEVCRSCNCSTRAAISFAFPEIATFIFSPRFLLFFCLSLCPPHGGAFLVCVCVHSVQFAFERHPGKNRLEVLLIFFRKRIFRKRRKQLSHFFCFDKKLCFFHMFTSFVFKPL